MTQVTSKWPSAARDGQGKVPGVVTVNGRFGDEFPSVLAAAQAGDEVAWARLYDALAPQVGGYLRSRGSVDVDDLVGEVFLHLARGVGRFEGDEARFRSWVFMIATSRVIDERRRRTRRPTDPLSDADIINLTDPVDVEEAGVAAVAAVELGNLLSVLTPDQRIVVELRIFSQLTGEEIATVVGKPLTAVKALQRRAFAHLRRHLAAQEAAATEPAERAPVSNRVAASVTALP